MGNAQRRTSCTSYSDDTEATKRDRRVAERDRGTEMLKILEEDNSMLVNKQKTRNWNAVSAVNVQNETGDPVMYMNASYNGVTVNFGKNIQNMELYTANKQTVDADYAQFEAEVLAEIGE